MFWGGLILPVYVILARGSVDFFSGITQYKTNEIGLIGYRFVYVLGGFNFACLCYTSEGECGFFLE